MQVVVQNELRWAQSSSLSGHLDDDKRTPSLQGARLAPLGLVENLSGTLFVLTAHRPVYDRWSMNLLYERLNHLYSSKTVSDP